MVWRQALRAESAVATGGYAASLLWDLQSFFDTVDLELLWRKAVRANFPLIPLRLALSAYSAPRAVQTSMGRAGAVRPTRGVAPGCSFAKALIHLYYLEDLDAFVAAHKDVQVDVYIDDITISVYHPSYRVVEERFVAAAASMAGLVVNKLKCSIAVSKASPVFL